MSEDHDPVGHWVAKGLDPDPTATALLKGTILDPTDLDGLGIEGRVAEYYQRFEGLGHSRAVMKLARAAGIPYSEARHIWDNPDDLAAELAWDMYQRDQAERSCPDCGLDPELMTGEDKRPLKNGAVKVVEFFCPACYLVDKARRERSAEAGKDGAEDLYGNAIKHRLAYRAPGEPISE